MGPPVLPPQPPLQVCNLCAGLEPVCTVWLPVEGQPLDVFTQHEARGHQQLGEVQRVDAVLLVLLELEAGVLEQVDGVLGVHVLPRETRGTVCESTDRSPGGP